MTDIIVAVIATLGTLLGSFGGILTSNRLLSYRMDRLEKRVERQTLLLESLPAMVEQMKTARHRIDNLEQWQKEVHHERKGHEITLS